jgi:hypothetical protein
LSEEKLFTKIAGKFVRQSPVVALSLFFATSAFAQTANVQTTLADPKFKAAADFVAKDHNRLVDEIIQITEIEAPPFKEAKRAKVFSDMLRQSGLNDVGIDSEGNVIGIKKGSGSGPVIAIAAHLDTVFPEGTNVRQTATFCSSAMWAKRARAICVE